MGEFGKPFVGGGGENGAFSRDEANARIIPADTADSWVAGSDRMDRDPADATRDSRAFFNKAKGSFRAGVATGTQWDDANVGVNSHAEGNDTTASGQYSHAEGYLTEAVDSAAHAEGVATYAGWRSHAEGANTDATAYVSHTEGQGTAAVASYSHAEGSMTQARGASSHAEGDTTIASGTASHAEGGHTTASGAASHAEGSNTTASGQYAHAEGYNTMASGPTSHAEGHTTEATAYYAHASGERAIASRAGQLARANGSFAVAGDAQASHIILKQTTTDATAGILMAFGSTAYFAAPDTNVWTLLANRAHKVRIEAIARRTDVEGEVAGFTWEGVVARGTTAARIVGTGVTTKWGDAPATDAWALGVAINATDAANPYLEITGTGEIGKTIRWVASLHVTEVG